MDKAEFQMFAAFVILALVIGSVFYIVSDYYWQEEQRRIAEKKCKEYIKYACDHPASTNSAHIIQGEVAPLGAYPHMAFVQFVDMKDPQIRRSCGGSLISENYVLSAAHCIQGLKNIAGIAKLGSVNRNLTNDTGELYKIKRLYVNPFYKHSAGVNDYILLELNRKVEFTSNLRPICLNTKYSGKYNRIIATGWGRTENANFSEALRAVDLIIDGDVAQICPKVLRGLATYFICAGFPNSSKSVHQGDSGGPLQIPSDSECANTYVQIGVTSLVQDRDYDANTTLLSFYGIVANVVPWIAGIVWPDESA